MGLVHIYCGDGKGKTTAAVGLAVRARGRDMPVLFQQFLKDGTSAELEPLRRLGASVYSGMPREASGFTWTLSDEQKELLRAYQDAHLRRALDWLREHKEAAGVLVLDEILGSLTLELADAELTEQLVSLCHEYPEGPDLVLTGRGPSEHLLTEADYITEMKAVRHPFEEGQAARPGIEF